ncbi:MAG: SURF1 family protein [Acidimicrobiia bacterium]
MLSRRWIFGHLVAVAVVVLFVNLGFWQLRRLDERRQLNALVEARMDGPAVPLRELRSVPGPDGDESLGQLDYRRVVVSGLYDPEQEVLVLGKTYAGRTGYHVLTPLVTDGEAVLVSRGWVPIEWGDPPVPEAVPPSGPVEVTGVLLPSRSGSGSSVDGDRVEVMTREDIDLVDAQTRYQLLPDYLLLAMQAPAQGDFPVPADPPRLGEGRHLSYAVQWFLFASIVVVGYPVLLRKTLRHERHRVRSQNG